MSDAGVLFPDTAAAAAAYLDSVLSVAVVTHVPNPRPDEFVTLRRTGGPRETLVSDGAQITVESWGPDDETAHDNAQTARAYLHAAAGTVIEGVQFYRVDELAGPVNLPDPESAQSRFTFTVIVGARGAAL